MTKPVATQRSVTNALASAVFHRPTVADELKERLAIEQQQFALGEIGTKEVRQRLKSWSGHAAQATGGYQPVASSIIC